MVYYFRRFFAFYLDAVIIAVLSIVVYSIFQLTVYKSLIDQEMLLLIQLVFTISYYFLMDFFFQRTIGKFIFKFEIAGYIKSNSLLLIKQIAIRNLTRFIPMEPISIFFNEDNRMWHDSLSKTTVVDIRKKI